MTLFEEFEQDVEVVVEALKKCAEIIEQQFIRSDLTVVLQKDAGKTVGRAINRYLKVSCYTESPVKEFRRILKFLALYVPQANPAEIEKRYIDIVKNPLRVTQTPNGPTLCNELLDKKAEVLKLVEDLSCYVKIANALKEPAETDSQQSKIGFLSELAPDEKRNEHRNR